MAKLRELTPLFEAIATADWQRARAVAQGIVDAEEKVGHYGAATTLRGALSATGPLVDSNPTAPETAASLATPRLLQALPPSPLKSVHLPDAVRKELAKVLREHRHRTRLEAHGLRPRSRLFFHGPPGCGKTLTARALGTELGLPVFAVRFDSLVGSYLGQTALRLSEVFRFAATNRCVLLIDEIDAVGRVRGQASDIAELDRVVISLMQQLDFTAPMGLLIAASNVPEQLDPALLRRFDLVIKLPVPSKRELAAYAKEQAQRRGIQLVNGARQNMTLAKTFADVDQLVANEHRSILLKDV
jgi:Holliday junction resolvasome RuvABC ATP-dependent DNA helicase subunit